MIIIYDFDGTLTPKCYIDILSKNEIKIIWKNPQLVNL